MARYDNLYDALYDHGHCEYEKMPYSILFSKFDDSNTNSTVFDEILELLDSDREVSREALEAILKPYKKHILEYLSKEYADRYEDEGAEFDRKYGGFPPC